MSGHCRDLVLGWSWPCLVVGFGAVQAADREAAKKPTADRQAAEILAAAGVQGGMIVHLGCGDGRLTAALRASDRCTVHGLDTDPASIESARSYLRQRGIYGAVSVERLSGSSLPYADNTVNLLVVSGPLSVGKEEVLRVLAPGGVVYSLDASSLP